MFELVLPLSGVPINLAITCLISSHSFSGRSVFFLSTVHPIESDPMTLPLLLI